MEKLTKQGVRDLNSIGSKKTVGKRPSEIAAAMVLKCKCQHPIRRQRLVEDEDEFGPMIVTATFCKVCNDRLD